MKILKTRIWSEVRSLYENGLFDLAQYDFRIERVWKEAGPGVSVIPNELVSVVGRQIRNTICASLRRPM